MEQMLIANVLAILITFFSFVSTDNATQNKEDNFDPTTIYPAITTNILLEDNSSLKKEGIIDPTSDITLTKNILVIENSTLKKKDYFDPTSVYPTLITNILVKDNSTLPTEDNFDRYSDNTTLATNISAKDHIKVKKEANFNSTFDNVTLAKNISTKVNSTLNKENNFDPTSGNATLKTATFTTDNSTVFGNTTITKFEGLEIIGGDETTIEKHPYIIVLQSHGGHICGGSIITEVNIVTAAHCVKSRGRITNPKTLSIRAGSTNKKRGGQVIQVKYLMAHKGYNEKTMNNDIALLLLTSSLKFNNAVRTIPLPKANEQAPAPGSPIVISGWGHVKSKPKPVGTDFLREVTVFAISHADCNARYGRSRITKYMFCTGIIDVGGKDACQGDSGGPVTMNGVLVGVVSWGIGCAEKRYPGVNALVSIYIPWIEQSKKEILHGGDKYEGEGFDGVGIVNLILSVIMFLVVTCGSAVCMGLRYYMTHMQ